MDYALEYAIMSDIYDNVMYGSVMESDRMADYVNTHRGVGKAAAVVKYLFMKALGILTKILSFIPRLISKIIHKIRGDEETDLSHLAVEFTKINKLTEERYVSVLKGLSNLSPEAIRCINNSNVEGLKKVNTSFADRVTQLGQVKDWLIKYSTEVIKKACEKNPKLGDNPQAEAQKLWESLSNALNAKKTGAYITSITKDLKAAVDSKKDTDNQELAKACLEISNNIAKVASITGQLIKEAHNAIEESVKEAANNTNTAENKTEDNKSEENKEVKPENKTEDNTNERHRIRSELVKYKKIIKSAGKGNYDNEFMRKLSAEINRLTDTIDGNPEQVNDLTHTLLKEAKQKASEVKTNHETKINTEYEELIKDVSVFDRTKFFKNKSKEEVVKLIKEAKALSAKLKREVKPTPESIKTAKEDLSDIIKHNKKREEIMKKQENDQS